MKNKHFEENFLLRGELARRLYFEVAGDLPIIDFHNHLSVSDLKENRKYGDIYEAWLANDPYKHRAMRILGVPEKYITGDSEHYEKFLSFCEIFPRLIGTPLFDWSMMELRRVFGIDIMPSEKTAREIWDRANDPTRSCELSIGSILGKFNIEYSAPCVSLLFDPSALVGAGYSFSARCDDLLSLDIGFFDKLSEITGIGIKSLESLSEALEARLSALSRLGLKFTDHALDSGFVYLPDDGRCAERFSALISGKTLSATDRSALVSEILRMLGSCYARYNLLMQLHIGAERKTSDRLRAAAGAQGGFAAIGDGVSVSSLVGVLRDIENRGGLPKTLIFTLNPADHARISTLSGSFSRDGVSAVVSEGAAWWWCDHLQGMRELFDHLASYSVLDSFFGMTTDSRSPLSFVRHDYFRRALCAWIGDGVERGELFGSFELWKRVVEDVCYKNAKNFIDGGLSNAL